MLCQQYKLSYFNTDLLVKFVEYILLVIQKQANSTGYTDGDQSYGPILEARYLKAYLSC